MVINKLDWNSAIDAVLDICDKFFFEEERAARIAQNKNTSIEGILAEERSLALARLRDEIEILRM